MKRILLLSCCMLGAFYLKAQITYNSSNFAKIGDSVRVSTVSVLGSNLNFAQAGANLTWDFSTLGFSNQRDVKYLNPNNTGYKFAWCASKIAFDCDTRFNVFTNRAISLLDSLVVGGFALRNVINHYNLSGNTFENKMIGATINGIPIPLILEYQKPDVIYQFPLQYNNTNTTDSRLVFDLTPFNIPLKYATNGVRTNTVEGWGTLLTPFQTFNSTLKLKSVINIKDTVVAGTTVIPTERTEVVYEWFDRNFGIPVLRVSGLIVAGVEILTEAVYIDTKRCVTPTALFIYEPILPYYDSVTRTATVKFTNFSSSTQSVEWNFGDGSPVSNEINPMHTFECPGQQNVTLTVFNTTCTPQKPASITLPVFIIDTTQTFTPLDSVIVQEGNTLRARQNDVSYQWLDCNNNFAPIEEATAQTFDIPEEGGNFAVRISRGRCQIDTSVCISTLPTALRTYRNVYESFEISPNPFTDKVMIRAKDNEIIERILVTDLQGRYIMRLLPQAPSAELFLAGKQGVFILKISTKSKKTYHVRVVGR